MSHKKSLDEFSSHPIMFISRTGPASPQPGESVSEKGSMMLGTLAPYSSWFFVLLPQENEICVNCSCSIAVMLRLVLLAEEEIFAQLSNFNLGKKI